MHSSKRQLQAHMLTALTELSRRTTFAELEETAIPSYVHTNPLVRAIFWGRVRAIVSAVERLSPSRVLDFGCGSAIITFLLDPSISRSVFDVYYLPFDFVRMHLSGFDAVAQLHNPDLSSIEHHFDVIVAADVLEHFQPNELANQLHLFHRWLKPGGHVVISGPTENLWYRIGRWVAGFSGHYHHMTVKDVARAAVETNRFICVRTLRYPIPFALEGFKILTFRAI